MTPGKRCLDVLLVLLLILPLGCLMLVIAVMLLAVQGRPVFFASVRMRSPDRSFRLWKFRTMRPGPETVTAGHSAARVTWCGGLLRRVRLDELPQIWNILRGDMTFVGPRPPLPALVAARPALYARVLASRPGVTGLASLVFHRHEARILARCRSPADAEQTYLRRCVARKARIDLIYQARRS
jgi:lipopolysaccharide/colanic/teichoic acid biosynthesis glycosyltransferase